MADGLIVAGGASDPNVRWLIDVAASLGVECDPILVDPENPPAFDWDLCNALRIDGRTVNGSALFCRYDVFSALAGQVDAGAASAWFAALHGFGLARGLRMLNAEIAAVTSSKPAMLILAAQCGLQTAPTIISNDLAALRSLSSDWVAKPVGGGSYAMPLDEALTRSESRLERLAAPAIVQRRLSYPEHRIYRVGEKVFAFNIEAETVDSRLDPHCRVTCLDTGSLPQHLMASIRRLTDAVRADFCAMDFKSDPETGELLFLELNNHPMFVGYDQAAGGLMARAMLSWLLGSAR